MRRPAAPRFTRRPTRAEILRVVCGLQNLVGDAAGHIRNDRDPNGFERGCDKLEEAFDLCCAARAFDPPDG